MSNVGYATVSIIPSAKGFGAALNKEIGPSVAAGSARAGKEAGGKFKGAMLAPLAGMGPMIAGALGAAAVGSFLKGAVDQASDLSEVGTALNQVFGKDGIGAVEQFGATGAKALGITKLEALKAAQTFGVYGKAAGLSGKENAKFSTTLASLGTDLASFYNTSPEEAIQAIGSGLRGEAEPLRRFGILLDDATLRQEALRMGLIKNTKQALTPQNKVLAAQAVIMKQSKVAQGDFARTSGGLANQQRILAAQFGDLKGKIGGALLPVVLSATQGLNGMFDGAVKVGTGLGGIFSILTKGDFAGASKTFGLQEDDPIIGVLFKIREGFTTAVDAVKLFFGAFTGNGADAEVGGLTNTIIDLGASARSIFDSLSKTLTGTVIPAVTAVAGYFAANVIPIFKSVYTVIATQVLPIILSLAQWFYGTIVPAVVGVAIAVGQRLKPVLDAIFTVIKNNVLPAVQQILAKFREWQPTLQMVVGVVVQVIGWVLKLAASILGTVLPPIIKFAGFLLGVVVKAVLAVIGVVISIIGWIVRFGVAVVGGISKVGAFVTGLKAKFGEAVTFVKGIPGKILSALGNLGSTLLSAGGDLIAGFVRGIKNAAGTITSAIKSAITDHLPDFVKDKLGIHSPSRVFMELGGHVGDGMALGIASKKGAVTKAADALVYTPNAAGAAGAGAAGSALVGSLTVQSTGNTKSDLDEALFQLRRINRGGR